MGVMDHAPSSAFVEVCESREEMLRRALNHAIDRLRVIQALGTVSNLDIPNDFHESAEAREARETLDRLAKGQF